MWMIGLENSDIVIISYISAEIPSFFKIIYYEVWITARLYKGLTLDHDKGNG